MKKPLNVLLIEDSEDDALINIEELRKADFDPIFTRVQTENDVRNQLESKTWDIILADYQMPGFLGTDALKIVRQMGLDIPFIMITGTLGEEKAVQVMKDGANDYFIKGNLKRLGVVVERELREYKIRKKQREADIASRQSEEQNRKLIELNPDGIIILLDGKVIFVNNAASQLMGETSERDCLKKIFLDYVHPDFRTSFKEFINKIFRKTVSYPSIQLMALRPDKTQIHVEIVGTTMIYQNKEVIYLILRDTSHRWQAQTQISVQQKINEIFTRTNSLFIAANQIMEYLCIKLSFNLGQILSFNNENKLLHCIGSSNPNEDTFFKASQKLDVRSERCILEKVLTLRKPIWIVQLSEVQDFIRAKEAGALGLKSGIFFPILYGKDVLGVMEFFSTEVRPIDNLILTILESIGTQIGNYIKQKYTEDAFLYYTDHDPITGFLNTNAFINLLKKTLGLNLKEKIVIISLALDNYKIILDAFGIGILQQLLKLISNFIHSSLSSVENFCAREEDGFLIAIINPDSLEIVQDILNELQAIFTKIMHVQDNKINIFGSIGVSLYPEDDQNAENLVNKAIIAKSKAREHGSNMIQFFTPSMPERIKYKMLLAAELKEAISKLEFVLYYQPKVELTTNKIVGIEALVRWERPQGILLPVEFIPILEETGLIIPLTEWILKAACEYVKKCHNSGFPELTVSVNLSVRHFKDPKLIDSIKQVLTKSNLEAKYLELEITESFFSPDIKNSLDILYKINALGLRLSIDDFGTGYSSFSYAKDMPVHSIKIDQSFINNCLSSTKDAAIVHSIIVMAHSLNLKVIAEGVSSNEIVEFLKEEHCDEIQGYLISQPLSEEELIPFLEHYNEKNH